MRKLALLCLVALCAAGLAQAQKTRLTTGDVYCAGMVTREAVPTDMHMISGEQSNHQTVWAQGEYVYINRGSSSGVKVGDKYTVMRPLENPRRVKWFKYEPRLMAAMGTQYADLGILRVVHVEAGTSVAYVDMSCDYLQRGDIVRPFADRFVPEVKAFDGYRWPAPSGKQQAMVVSAKGFNLQIGTNDIGYLNIGSAQGAKAGDYIRIFRYQGTRHETAYQLRNTQYMIWGFGKTPIVYKWSDLPRELLGEGVVLRVTENAATVFITHALKPIFMGDYAEIK
jgi:hypothetical protein